MILAGVLLKMGGYGIIRICYPICPDAGYDLAWFVCGLGVVSMVYGAFAALAQKDFKRLVAYSSVSHMGYVVLGFGVWSMSAGNGYNAAYMAQGWNGAMFQMIAHGISSAGMFFMVGVVLRPRPPSQPRRIRRPSSLACRFIAGLAYVRLLRRSRVAGPLRFIGEVFVTLCVWNYSKTLAVISARSWCSPRRTSCGRCNACTSARIQGPARRPPARRRSAREAHRRAARRVCPCCSASTELGFQIYGTDGHSERRTAGDLDRKRERTSLQAARAKEAKEAKLRRNTPRICGKPVRLRITSPPDNPDVS